MIKVHPNACLVVRRRHRQYQGRPLLLAPPHLSRRVLLDGHLLGHLTDHLIDHLDMTGRKLVVRLLHHLWVAPVREMRPWINVHLIIYFHRLIIVHTARLQAEVRRPLRRLLRLCSCLHICRIYLSTSTISLSRSSLLKECMVGELLVLAVLKKKLAPPAWRNCAGKLMNIQQHYCTPLQASSRERYSHYHCHCLYHPCNYYHTMPNNLLLHMNHRNIWNNLVKLRAFHIFRSFFQNDKRKGIYIIKLPYCS